MAALVEVGRFQSLPEAVVAKSCLEAHGHFVVAMEYHHASMAWHHLFAIGGIRLAAPAVEADQVQRLLATIVQESATTAEAEVSRETPGLAKRCLSIVLLFSLFVIIPPQVIKRRPAL
jgi:hypothetical protein